MGTLCGLATIAAAARTVIRVHHFKLINVEDYLVFVALTAHIIGTVLSILFALILYKSFAISQGKLRFSSNFIRNIENASQYVMATESLCWLTIFSIKWSFLFYFKALTYRLKRMELWWWFIVILLVPITTIAIFSPFITCPHAGRSILGMSRFLFMQCFWLIFMQCIVNLLLCSCVVSLFVCTV